jgi:hypothetical protein
MANPWFHSNGPLWMTAIVGGLIVTMLLAVMSPRLFAAEGPGWLVSLVAGALVAAGIVIWGYARRRAGEEEEHPPAQ